jgi:hypothetical protein
MSWDDARFSAERDIVQKELREEYRRILTGSPRPGRMDTRFPYDEDSICHHVFAASE